MPDPQLPTSLAPYLYRWPRQPLGRDPRWRPTGDGEAFVYSMPETPDELSRDSRWPALFPSPICFVTTGEGGDAVLEKVVGASIVNRFPYIMALSFCRESLSPRHHRRDRFMQALEAEGTVAVQYLPPGASLDAAMSAIGGLDEERANERIAASGLDTRPASRSATPVLADAYMVYEGRLVQPGRDFDGEPIYPRPYHDIGSHRVYFIEIHTIQLRDDIAEGRSQVRWRSLPAWQPPRPVRRRAGSAADAGDTYRKTYQPHYAFPSRGTIAFAADESAHGMAIKHLPPLAGDQVEVDNDAARWPCFFPSSAGMISSRQADGTPNVMPCGSTTVLSRHPLIIAPCVSYAKINVRYAPRASLDLIRRGGRFGCGVPFIEPNVIDAIIELGNTSSAEVADKVARTGLRVETFGGSPMLSDLPVHFDCKVVGELRLGTHVMFLGEVEAIRVRRDVMPESSLEWCPWAAVEQAA